MKNLIFLFAALIVMASCHNYKEDTQNLLVEKDSILVESKIKDSSIMEFLDGYNQIQANLDSIKKMEKMVTIQANTGKELDVNQKIMILEDIQLINELLQKNREQITLLQNRLKSSAKKVGKLEAVELMLTNLENLNQNMKQEKDAEIFKLNTEIQNSNLNVTQLSEKIIAIETDNKQKAQTIKTQTNEMNQAFYTMGSTKELRDEGILLKTGGFLGIGRTPIIENDFNQENFTAVDIRDFDYFPLMMKKANLLSVHSAASFHISGEKNADTLFIDNKSEFWKATNYLVILAD